MNNPPILPRNGAYGIVMRGVHFCTCAGASLRGRNVAPLCCINYDAITDPPYNTGNDSFIYDDDSNISDKEFSSRIGLKDDDGNILFDIRANNESNGRFHTDWLNMMYSRLRLAKALLADDGVIFISIGENEQTNSRKIGEEIFGSSNFITCCTRIAKRTSNKGTYFKPTKDYILVFAKNINQITWKFGVYQTPDLADFPYEDEKGRYKKNGASLYQPSLDSRPNQRYWIQCPDGSFIIPPGSVFPDKLQDAAFVKPLSNKDKCWRWSWPTYLANKDKLMFTPASSSCPLVDSNGNPSKWNIYDKVYFENKDGETLLPEDVIYDYVNSQGTKELIDIDIPFSFAKPTGLIQYLIEICRYSKDITVLDFFSGSSSTASAVMQLNASDGGTRKFIMVQLPETCNEFSEAYKAGYKNICEIGKERIRRAGEKIKKEIAFPNGEKNGAQPTSHGEVYTRDYNGEKQIHYVDQNFLDTETGERTTEYFSPSCERDKYRFDPNLLDIGFRDLKLDSSNMKDVYYKPNDYAQASLDDMVSNIKSDRTPLDLLFQVMLDLGKPLSAKIEEKIVAGKHVFVVSGNDLVCCFDEQITDEVVKAIAEMKPLYAVFRDSSLATDSVGANFDQIFATYSPNTVRKVL